MAIHNYWLLTMVNQHEWLVQKTCRLFDDLVRLLKEQRWSLLTLHTGGWWQFYPVLTPVTVGFGFWLLNAKGKLPHMYSWYVCSSCPDMSVWNGRLRSWAPNVPKDSLVRMVWVNTNQPEKGEVNTGALVSKSSLGFIGLKISIGFKIQKSECWSTSIGIFVIFGSRGIWFNIEPLAGRCDASQPSAPVTLTMVIGLHPAAL